MNKETKQLITDHVPLAIRVAHKVSKLFYSVGVDELVSHALYILTMTAEAYDDSKCKFSTYVYTVVYRKLLTFCDREIRIQGFRTDKSCDNSSWNLEIDLKNKFDAWDE